MQDGDERNGTSAEGKGNPEDNTQRRSADLVHFETHFGQLVLAAAKHERYRRLSLADLDQLLLQPLLAGRVAIGSQEGDRTRAGVAIWASVSPEVSTIIAGHANAGTFPVRIAKTDWRSGDEVWLLDVIAPDLEVSTAVFGSFSQLISGPFRVHPAAFQALDPEIVKRISAGISGFVA